MNFTTFFLLIIFSFYIFFNPRRFTHTHFPLPMTHHMNILVTLSLNWNNYRKLKEPFLPRPQKMQVRISTCALYMYLIHFICFGFSLKVRTITQDLLQTSVNLRRDEVVYSVCGLIQSCPVMPINCSIKFKHLP